LERRASHLVLPAPWSRLSDDHHTALRLLQGPDRGLANEAEDLVLQEREARVCKVDGFALQLCQGLGHVEGKLVFRQKGLLL